MASDADILGIVAIVIALIGLFFEGIILGIIAIVLALIGRSKDKNNIYCLLGLILGIVAFVLGLYGLLQRGLKAPPGQNK